MTLTGDPRNILHVRWNTGNGYCWSSMIPSASSTVVVSPTPFAWHPILDERQPLSYFWSTASAVGLKHTRRDRVEEPHYLRPLV